MRKDDNLPILKVEKNEDDKLSLVQGHTTSSRI